jgi:hypothetical protein
MHSPIPSHTSHHSHSLGGKDDSRSYLAPMAKAEIHHQTHGEKKGHLSLIKGSVGHRSVHMQGHGYMYRLINSAERIHLEP